MDTTDAASRTDAPRFDACVIHQDFLGCVSRSKNSHEVDELMKLNANPMTAAGLAALPGVPTVFGIVAVPASSS